MEPSWTEGKKLEKGVIMKESEVREQPKNRRLLRALLAVMAAAVLAMGVVGMSACSSSSDSSSSSDQTTESESSGTHTVTDAVGNVAEVPNEVDSVVVPFPAAAQTVLGLGGADKLTGGFVLSSDLNKIMFPDVLANIKTIRPNSINAESIMECDPDLLILPSTLESVPDDVKATGVPMLMTVGTTSDEMKSDCLMIGDALGGDAPERAQKYVDFYDNLEATVTEMTSDIPDEERPIVYLCISEDPTETQGVNSISTEWIYESGGISMVTQLGLESDDLNMNLNVTAEQIIECDPDIIICTTVAARDTFLTDPTYAGLSAVQNGKVYLNPLGGSVWFKAHFEAPLELAWAPTVIAPEETTELDTRAYVDEFYQTFYDHELTDEEYQLILNPSVGSN